MVEKAVDRRPDDQVAVQADQRDTAVRAGVGVPGGRADLRDFRGGTVGLAEVDGFDGVVVVAGFGPRP